ncbi:MAG: hypothetical protein HY290_11690 [Planctomycetia bacterium]|nr:hypothetical protein [Planctomycetia bacterium]
MRSRVFGLCFLLVTAWSQTAVFAADEKVEALKEAPQGLSAEVAAAIAETGFRITGKDGTICDVWLAKEIPLKPKFKSSLRIKYPFQTGQLVGVIRYPESSKPNDFRGQALKAGTYTLRYGLQPDDGNHLGTSDIRDFLVGCPPDKDASAKRIEDIKDLFKLSAAASGSTHPAIFLLIPPPDKPFDAASLAHDNDKHLLIFQSNANAKDADKTVSVPLSIVTVGKSEG